LSKGWREGGEKRWQVRTCEIAAQQTHPFWTHAMIVIALTAFVGLALVTFFIVLFISYAASGGGIEHEALLPLEDETPAIIVTRQP
jgi:hypothetical protein